MENLLCMKEYISLGEGCYDNASFSSYYNIDDCTINFNATIYKYNIEEVAEYKDVIISDFIKFLEMTIPTLEDDIKIN